MMVELDCTRIEEGQSASVEFGPSAMTIQFGVFVGTSPPSSTEIGGLVATSQEIGLNHKKRPRKHIECGAIFNT